MGRPAAFFVDPFAGGAASLNRNRTTCDASRRDGQWIVRRCLGTRLVRIHRLTTAVDDEVVDAVLDVRTPVRTVEDALVVRLVFGEQQIRRAFSVEEQLLPAMGA